MLFKKFYVGDFKGGITYVLNHNYILLLGEGRYRTYDPKHLSSGPTLTENHAWEQLIITNRLRPLLFEQHYRVEQRWTIDEYRSRPAPS